MSEVTTQRAPGDAAVVLKSDHAAVLDHENSTAPRKKILMQAKFAVSF